MPSRFASISVLPRNSPASAICALTIPIQAKKRLNTSIQSNKTCFGWGLTGIGEFYASDYFEQLYEFAIQLIKAGKAFVCDLSADQMREYRGTLTEPGKE